MPNVHPTPAELGILRVLWRLESATVRDVHEELSKSDPVGYTTVLKQLQIMHRKGSVARDTSKRSHVYRATEEKERTQRSLLTDLIERAFGGSALSLVVQALSDGSVSEEELQSIRELIDAQERVESGS